MSDPILIERQGSFAVGGTVLSEGVRMPYAALPGNLQMYYEDDDFTDPWTRPETVILHHGNAKSSRFWYAWVPLLARDFRVIRLDARGFGRSTVPSPGYDWSLEGFADDLAHLMDALSIGRAHLIGESVGGTIGLQFAYRHPARLHSLTTCTSPYKFKGVDAYPNHIRLIQEEGVEAWVRKTADRRLQPGHSDPEHQQWYIRQMSATKQHVVLDTLAYLANVDLAPVLQKIQVPTMVMVGQNSSANTPDRAQNMAKLLPRGVLVEVPGASGFVQHSAPAACVALWREFRAALSAKN